jgi:glycine cleavage system transcriptional repressor
MRHLAVSAIGRDRPGIVAGVTRVLLDHDLNVEDSQMTILRGRFTMMLVVSAADAVDVEALRAGLARAADELELDAVSVEDVTGASADDAPEPSHIVTVYGVDHPGIVHGVAEALAGAGIDITDLNTRLVSDAGGEDLYAMMLEVALPRGVSGEALESVLGDARRRHQVDVSVRELERDAL